MLRCSLLKAGRLASALGRQPLHHPSGSVLAGSQVQYRSRMRACQAHWAPSIQNLLCAVCIEGLLHKQSRHIQCGKCCRPAWSVVTNLLVFLVLCLCTDTSLPLVDVLQHKHNADNNWETPFDFTDENYEIVRQHYH